MPFPELYRLKFRRSSLQLSRKVVPPIFVAPAGCKGPPTTNQSLAPFFNNLEIFSMTYREFQSLSGPALNCLRITIAISLVLRVARAEGDQPVLGVEFDD